MISVHTLRELRSQFWLSKHHTYLPEASLVADRSSSTAMFTLAGMQQLIPYLSGAEHPLGSRLFNIQKCIRTIDIEQVGDDTHLTLFEMMGNRSLGDYFKKEAIYRSWEFLTDTQWLGLDPKKLAVTVFAGDNTTPRDDESAQYRKELGMHNISYLGVDDNWRSPGPVGPCGPDTEIFYWVGDKRGGPQFPPADSTVGSDPDNWVEIWNNVFMQYYRHEDGSLDVLPKHNVDTGMGLERICSILQNVPSPYETDIFTPIVHHITSYLSISYDQPLKKIIRIFADHVRTSTLLLFSGLYPSNEGPGYVLRRLIRRFAFKLYPRTLTDESFFHNLIPIIFSTLDMHDYSFTTVQALSHAFIKELSQFYATLHVGLKELRKILDRIGSTKSNYISASDAFKLYDTYGFPIELTSEVATEYGCTVDIDGFVKLLNQQKHRSRTDHISKRMHDIDWSMYIRGIPPTQFVGYDGLQTTARLLKDLTVHDQRVLIFDRTVFYAESGGQTADAGVVQLDSGEEVRVVDVQSYEGVYLHFVQK